MQFSWTNRTETQRVSKELTSVSIELSTRCNLDCISCPRKAAVDFRPAHMEDAVFLPLLESLRALKSLNRIVLIEYGEALCNPRAMEYLRALGTLGAAVTLVTNGHLVTPQCADLIAGVPLEEVVFSWDDPVTSSSSPLRVGAQLEQLERGIGEILSSRRGHGTGRPLLALETVVRRENAAHLRGIIAHTRGMGIEKWYVSNLFPYREDHEAEIIYVNQGKPLPDLRRLLKREMRECAMTVAGQVADIPRRCPFMERGSLFVTAMGEVAPCMELAYTHRAVYFGNPRTHHRTIYGSVTGRGLAEIWGLEDFRRFRECFLYWDFPDCSTCYDPRRCYNRTDLREDCYGNPTPCGECLWAKNIVLCP
ncbi:MAG: SPASM domain-containing protein [Spirochaetes bacterium]|nr:SPASM domain-containing protein [Spirochaetota bacterium]